MAKLTIAQLRELEVKKLVNLDKRDIDEAQKFTDAKRIMNRFYRLSGLIIRNFYDDNNERTQNTTWHKEEEEKEERLRNKLDRDINELYNMNLVFAGLYPHIGIKENHCIKSIEIYGNWY